MLITNLKHVTSYQRRADFQVTAAAITLHTPTTMAFGTDMTTARLPR